jgi:hypothetical protein
MDDVNIAFASVNIIGAVLVALLMMETTPQASLQLARYDAQAMWGMVRRLFYINIAGGMAGMACWVYEKWIVLTIAEMVFWSMVVVPIALFQAIRALRWVDQDRWVGHIGSWHRREVANATAVREQEQPPKRRSL